VCSSWKNLCQLEISEPIYDSVVFHFETNQFKNQNEMDLISQELQSKYKKGIHIEELRICCGKYHTNNLSITSDFSILVNWEEKIFKYTPQLKRLDLFHMTLSSQHIVPILQVASIDCPLLEELILPIHRGITSRYQMNSTMVEQIMDFSPAVLAK
jgi:hypothetical protein